VGTDLIAIWPAGFAATPRLDECVERVTIRLV
jgi:hypothetical protein